MKTAHVIEPHFEAAVERCRAERFVLAIQDKTALNYDGLTATEGLDSLGGGGKGAKGILAHVGTAVNAAGRPMGMFSLDADFRRDDESAAVTAATRLDRRRRLLNPARVTNGQAGRLRQCAANSKKASRDHRCALKLISSAGLLPENGKFQKRQSYRRVSQALRRIGNGVSGSRRFPW